MPENFTRWVKDNEERIACASSLPYFLADNGKVSNGKYSVQLGKKDDTNISKIEMQRMLYNRQVSLNHIDAQKSYFSNKSGGFYIVNKEHKFSQVGGGGKAEIETAKVLADKGKMVELLKENNDRKSADMRFDNQTWDVKCIEKANENTIRKYIRDDCKAECAIFYQGNADKMKELHSAINREIGYYKSKAKLGELPNIYILLNNIELSLLSKNPHK